MRNFIPKAKPKWLIVRSAFHGGGIIAARDAQHDAVHEACLLNVRKNDPLDYCNCGGCFQVVHRNDYDDLPLVTEAHYSVAAKRDSLAKDVEALWD